MSFTTKYHCGRETTKAPRDADKFLKVLRIGGDAKAVI